MRKCNQMCTKRKYNAVIKAIPQALMLLTKGMLTDSVIIPHEPSLVIEGSSFLDVCVENVITSY